MNPVHLCLLLLRRLFFWVFRRYMFIQVLNKAFEEKRVRKGAGDITQGTLDAVESRYNNIRQFLQETGRAELTCRQVSKNLIREFETWCMGRKLARNYIQKTIGDFKHIMRLAVDMGYAHNSPIDHYRCKWDNDYKTQIVPPEDLRAMLTSEYLPIYANRQRELDRWIVILYTGYSWGDMKDIRNCIRRDPEDGQLWLIKPRNKTGQDQCIPLPEPARKILEKYDFEFPPISGQTHRDTMRLVQRDLYLKSKHSISPRAARRTCGQLLLDQGMSFEVVAAWLGHASIKTTEKHYAAVRKQRIVREALRKNTSPGRSISFPAPEEDFRPAA